MRIHPPQSGGSNVSRATEHIMIIITIERIYSRDPAVKLPGSLRIISIKL